ncbi:MAG: Rpn family recombination-promoting nuclease/putative transposase [Lachnospiraceae bacterium]|nr:Rpn family recombination-promoting nuclease/putative transposase [Lachnospiraceae bacterium]
MNQNTSSFWNAHGKIPYNMTNDYMFRAVLQYNNKVLRGLVCSLLHLKESEVRSVEITNSIILGESIKDKEVRLDINVILNNNTHINLEMQVANELNWPDRSVLYMSRSFDQLNHGQKYKEIKPVIHIGFLGYTLFKECPEFYATYKLINVNNNYVYSDKMTLSVVDLSKIDLATDVDKKYHIDKWASLFKATTWEDLKMIASDNMYLNEASQTIYHMNSEYWIRKVCQDREEYYLDMQCLNDIIAEQENTIQQLRAEIESLKGR